VKISREKEELPVAEGEAVASLGDPAFADDDRLAALAQGLADERPLLETDTLHFAACKTTLPPMPFKIDLHTHSFFSGDGVSSPEENIASARAKGLHGFVLTDHNTNDGVTYLLDKGLMREDGVPVDDFLIVPGVEVTTAEGHLLSIGASLPYLKGRPAREVCDLIHERGGLAIPPHPYDLFRAGIRFSTLEKLPIDAIEVFNAATTLRRYNRYAFKYAQVRGLPMTAASDAHHHAAIGTAYTILDTEDFSVRGILAQIVKSNELNQEYLTPKDSVRKTWNNWMRLRRRKTLPLRPAEIDVTR
jgi:predicted metal-dependent phosphoesterase TrpH